MAATEVPRQVREDILRDIATWPLAMQGVADSKRGCRATTTVRRTKRTGAKAEDSQWGFVSNWPPHLLPLMNPEAAVISGDESACTKGQ
jgi:hypothetical protein